MYLILVHNFLQRRQEDLVWKLRVGAVVGIVLQVKRVEPLPEAVVQSHVEPCGPHTGCQVTNEVSLGTSVHTVPVPVVGPTEIAPTFVMLRRQNNVCRSGYITLVTQFGKMSSLMITRVVSCDIYTELQPS